MILFSHPTGNANVRSVVEALMEAGLLEEFVTAVAAFPDNLFGRLALTGLGAEFGRRSYPESLTPLTRQRPLTELVRLMATRIGWKGLIQHEKGRFCIDRVCQIVDRCSARRVLKLASKRSQLGAVYCYEDCALATFEAAGQRGLHRFYDLPIGYWRAARQIQSEEAERLPEWAITMPALIDSEAKVARKDEELKLADAILVASSFTAKTLEDAPFDLPEPLMIPYGCPEVGSRNSEVRIRNSSKKLRVLFVGAMSQRKGLSYLFEAVERLGSAVELTVIGRKAHQECQPLEEGLKTCRYIPSLSHEKILEEMDRQDVFVFPSLFEGFGLVVTEALSRGLPVITTPHTCGPDVLTEGEDGFIVPMRDAEAIAEKLEQLHQDREWLAAMREAAFRKAGSLTWASYRDGVVSAVSRELGVCRDRCDRGVAVSMGTPSD